MNERRIRLILGILAGLSALLAIYANLVPLDCHPLSLAETWSRFQQIPWCQLGLEKRADWVGNGLALIPFGFFAASILHWRRPGIARKLISFALFAVLQGLFVCTIEFVQIWFPPRVLSQNDMLAGYIGGLVGFLMWHCVGTRMIDTAIEFARSPRGLPRIAILAQCCAFGLVLYGFMPYDVMLTPDEWSQKAASNRFAWLPFRDWLGIREAIKSILLSGWAFPLGVVLGLQHSRRAAIYHVLAWSLAIELASLPIFGRHTSVTDIVVAAILGWTGVHLSKQIKTLADSIDSAIAWLLAAATWTAFLLVSFTMRYERVVNDRQELSDRLWGILAVPFARAHASSEFEAAENILVKLLVFGLLGFLLAGWYSRCERREPATGWTFRDWRRLVAVAWVTATGLAVEISQAFLFPLVPDITDLLLYSTGAVLGAFGFSILIPPEAKIS